MRYQLAPIAAALLLSACGSENVSEPPASTPEPLASSTAAAAESGASNPAARQPLYGDLHVHTAYSFDAFAMGTLAGPDDAYHFAKGGVLNHPGGFPMQLDRPMDFYAVTDHAFFMGALRAMTNSETPLYEHELAPAIRTMGDEASRSGVFQTLIDFVRSDRRMELVDDQVFSDAWQDIIEAANRHNDPGHFTTFIGYEYTASGPEFENLHRNVIFDGDKAPLLPFSRLDSNNPEDLWRWMDQQRQAGLESLAIPHNSNGSNGWMFSQLDFAGNPLDASYAELRMRNEPLVENSQIKGTSDTHPALSPNDEWADFEIMKVRIASNLLSQPDGSYVRQALMRGLEFQAAQGFNPFKFGVIGSSDTHNGSYAGDDDNFWSKTGILDDEPKERGSVPLDGEPPRYLDTYRSTWSAGSLAAAWAEENTRESIYAAFRRKETFSTSGSRIAVRFFAGYDLPEPGAADWVGDAYAKGVPMGGDLLTRGTEAPSFLAWARQDAQSAPLARLQVIKASVRDGKAEERVFDIACPGGAAVDPESHRCPESTASVDLTSCALVGDGAAVLQARWSDPDYRPGETAMYYVRALENPSCRWSTWDALRTGATPNPALPLTIQERAWSSPIWLSAAAP